MVPTLSRASFIPYCAESLVKAICVKGYRVMNTQGFHLITNSPVMEQA